LSTAVYWKFDRNIRMSSLDFTHFFHPRSIAMIGASEDPATLRGRIVEYLLQRKYAGKLYLISANRESIRGRATYTSIRDVPDPIDLVLVAVRADLAEPVLRDCAEVGARFAVCFSSGFAEEGEHGVRMQESLSALARDSGLRICGPNTAGFFNVRNMIPATFTRSVDARRPAADLGRLESGTVGIVAQSGGLAFAQQHRCAAQHGLGFSQIISTGNEADLESLDFVESMLEDPETRVVLLLIESLKHPARLERVARRAAEFGKPIVVVKFGRTVAGSRAAISHAARLSGSDSGYEAAFRRFGLIRVDDEDDMADLAAAFSRCPLPQGNRVGIVTTSGGAGVWMADACELAGLSVPKFDNATQQALAAHVPSFGSTNNPVDITAQASLNPVKGGADAVGPLIGTLSTLDESDAVDAIILVANLSDGAVLERERDGLAALVRGLRKPLLLYTHALPSPGSLELLWGLGLSCFGSTRRTARALRGLLDYATFQRSAQAAYLAPLVPVSFPTVAPKLSRLTEYDAKAVLREYGIRTPREGLARTAEEAVAIGNEFGGPVALKIQSPDIPHKTEIGGVVLNLGDPDAVRCAYAELIERARRGASQARIDGVLVQEMVEEGTEMALGVVRDPDFGPLLVVSLGGIHIEVLNDAAIDLLPVNRATALCMLKRLRGAAILDGVRGKAPRDLDALAELMERVSAMVVCLGDRITEVDLNPIIVHEKGRGLAIVDAMIVGTDARDTCSEGNDGRRQ
jgi:acyl-CoA synthetase (NDP forming)